MKPLQLRNLKKTWDSLRTNLLYFSLEIKINFESSSMLDLVCMGVLFHVVFLSQSSASLFMKFLAFVSL